MINDFDKFADDLLNASQDLRKGKHSKKFMREEGTKLKRETVKDAKAKVKKRTGNLYKGIKRGKAFTDANDTLVLVYGSNKKGGASHAHLLNNGHRVVDKNGKEHDFVEGKFFFESALHGFEGEFHKDTEEFIDEMLKDHGL